MAKLSLARGVGVLALLGVLVALAFSTSSEAALLPTAPRAVCNPTSQIFLPWGDTANYGLVPGASFEGSLRGWSLNGAGVVADNESFQVGGASDSKALYIPAGVTVSTPPSCFHFADWQLRLFTQGTGQLRVRVVARGLLGGLLSLLDAGTVSPAPDGSWQLSNPVDIDLLTQLAGLLTSNSVSLQLTAIGGPVQVDDIYLDPSMGN